MTAVIDTNRVIVYARPTPDGEGILFGGRARFRPVSTATSARILHDQMLEIFPTLADVKITNAWSGLMAFTADYLPKLGVRDRVHYVLGCNGGSGVVLSRGLVERSGVVLPAPTIRPSRCRRSPGFPMSVSRWATHLEARGRGWGVVRLARSDRRRSAVIGWGRFLARRQDSVRWSHRRTSGSLT